MWGSRWRCQKTLVVWQMISSGLQVQKGLLQQGGFVFFFLGGGGLCFKGHATECPAMQSEAPDLAPFSYLF